MEGSKDNPFHIHAKLEKKLLKALEDSLHMDKVLLEVNAHTY